MKLELLNIAMAVGLFAGMLAFLALGRRIADASGISDPDALARSTGPTQATIFGLLGLLLAFSFSGAASRFEDRRHLIAQEANAIGTAYLRIDLLPAESQPDLRQLFRRYLDTRVATYRDTANEAATQARISEAATLQREIWSKAVSASGQSGVPTSTPMLLLAALNEMIDITTTRVVATQNHPPAVIYVLLAGLSLFSSMLAGYAMGGSKVRSGFCALLIAATLSLTIYVILDLEFPRLGLIRIDAADQTLVDLRNLMR